MKLFLVLVLLTPSLTLAQNPDYYKLTKDKKCFIKSYHRKHFTNQDPSKFYNIRLFAKPHKKNDRYSIFKYNNQIYVTLTSCLDPIEVWTADPDTFIDSAPAESDKYVNYAARNSRLVEGLRFNENNYFLELNLGRAIIPDSSQIFSDYSLFGNFEDQGSNQITLEEVAKNSEYSTEGLISFGGGWRWSDSSFFAFKFKRFKGSKKDEVLGKSTLGSGLIKFEYNDSITSFLIGNKFIFLPNSHLKPTLGFYLGLSNITSEMNIEDQEKLKFESTGVTAVAEAGLEYLFNTHFGIGLNIGYEYLGSRKFKFEGDKSESSESGFTSKLSYSNYFATIGARVYFR